MRQLYSCLKVKKYILQAVIVLSAATVLCAFGACGEGGRGGYVSGKEKAGRLYPSEAEVVEMAGMLPLVCTPVSECYQKEEEDGQGFSEELLTALQECVREGGMAAAIEAYRDDTLLIDVDTLLLLCPDYESLIAELEKERKSGLSGEAILNDIASVYRLDLDGDMLLVEYSNPEAPWFVLKKAEEGYLAGTVYLSVYSLSSWNHCGTAIFPKKDGYCMLEWAQQQETGEEEISLYYFTPEEHWVENVGEPGVFFEREVRYIREREARVVPVLFYLNDRHSLSKEAWAYVEENAYVFAGRLAEQDVIWGDEIPMDSEWKEVEVTWDTGERGKISLWSHEASRADYDNDGEEEWFQRTIDRWRGEGEESENVLLTAEGDGYRAEAISLYGGDTSAVRLWFVEFSEKTVTFEIVEPYGAAYPLLEAYLVEGEKKTLLLTCQLVYGKAVEIDNTAYGGGNNFSLRRVVPLITGLEKETQEQAAFRKELTAQIREAAGGAVVIEPLDAETPFPADFLEFIREGAAWCFSGKLFSAYAAPYAVAYSEKELEKMEEEFEEKYDEKMWWGLWRVVYRWEASDGTDNYLVRDSAGSDYGVNTLYWRRYDGTAFEEVPVTDFSCDYGSWCGVLSYDGQRYCVVVSTDERGQLWRIDLFPWTDNGEWEHYCISFYYEEKAYEVLSFSENDALNRYVEEEAEAIYAAAEESLYWGGGSYHGSGGWEDIPKEVWRDIKNRDFCYSQYRYSYSFGSASNQYIPADVDNDGELEYVSVYMVYGKRRAAGLEYTIYGSRNGIFTEFTMDGEGLLHYYADEDGGWGIGGDPDQIWFEEIDGVTYLFTVEQLTLFDGFLMRARVIQDDKVEDAGAWLFRNTGVIMQDIQKMGEYDSWLKA